MPPLLQRFLVSQFRYVLSAVMAWLAAKGTITTNEGTEYAVATATVIVMGLWSLWEKYKDRILLKLALEQPSNTSEAGVKALAEAGVRPRGGAGVIILAIAAGSMLISACGKHVVTGPPDAVTAHYAAAVLESLVDTEKTILDAYQRKLIPASVSDPAMAAAAKATAIADKVDAALVAWHAATGEQKNVLQGNITGLLAELDTAAAEIFGVHFPEGFAGRAAQLAIHVREAIAKIRQQFTPVTAQ